jgi:hypothetical protein
MRRAPVAIAAVAAGLVLAACRGQPVTDEGPAAPSAAVAPTTPSPAASAPATPPAPASGTADTGSRTIAPDPFGGVAVETPPFPAGAEAGGATTVPTRVPVAAPTPVAAPRTWPRPPIPPPPPPPSIPADRWPSR